MIAVAINSDPGSISNRERPGRYSMILGGAGPLPHVRPETAGPKQQTTRLLKCECTRYGYTVRTAHNLA
jgi:hypothetical protein